MGLENQLQREKAMVMSARFGHVSCPIQGQQSGQSGQLPNEWNSESD
jgi:hypothetical protein